MATPIGFKETTDVLGRPADMTDEECGGLPVFRNGEVVISRHKLSPQELAEVMETGCIWLGIAGVTQPPCWVSGHNPFVQST